jgi:hypothetical protein
MALGTIRAAVRGFAQRLGGTRVGVLAIGWVVSPLQRQLYRRTGGRFSLTGRAPVLLLTTTGRRTGKARTVPLLYLRDGNRVVICNVNPGFERPQPVGSESALPAPRPSPDRPRHLLGEGARGVRERTGPLLAPVGKAVTRLPGLL